MASSPTDSDDPIPNRPGRTGLIAYYFICDQEPVSERVPESLFSRLLRLAVEGPKSLLQLVDGERWFRMTVSFGGFPPKRFWVTYTPHVSQLVELISREPMVTVLLIHTADPRALEPLRRLRSDYFILSDLEDVQRTLERDREFRKRYCRSSDELRRKLARLAPAFLEIPKRTVCGGIHEQKTNARRLIEGDRLTFPPFRACRNNYAVFENLVDPMQVVDVDQPVIAHDTRPQALARSMDLVYRLHQVLLDFKMGGIDFSSQYPGLVLVAPSHDPWLKRQYMQRAQRMGAVGRRVLREYIQLSFAEQNLHDYNVEMTRKVNPAVAKAAMLSMVTKVQFLDDAGGFHASFEEAPYFRAPLRGASLNAHLAPFNPRQYSRRAQHESVFASIVAAGEEIGRGFPAELKIMVPVPIHRVVALSDLPIEWAMIDGEPLAFLTDLCRLPESPITSLLAQYSKNQLLRFVVRPGILNTTLVVCGAPEGDAIHRRFEQARTLAERHNLPVRFVHCLSCAAFMSAVEAHRPSLLIVDTHGAFGANEVGSVLQFGPEWLNGNQVAAMPNVPPLIFLSCCWGAPVYGCANTIAQAFFETGALSVTTTFLPVGVDEGTVLYFRLLNNLRSASVENFHRDWAAFLSHLLRTSYFHMCAQRIRRTLGADCFNEPDYHEAFSKWAARSMFPPNRKGLFTSAFDQLVGLIETQHKAQARRILERRDFLPEFLFYTTLGRADLILFEAYRQASFLPTAAEHPESDIDSPRTESKPVHATEQLLPPE